jgi:hypothetical protein
MEVKMRKINAKKLDMTMLYEFILLVAVIVIVSIMVFQITEDSREDILKAQTLTATCNTSYNGGTGSVYTGCGTAYNATLDSDTAVAKIPKSLKLLGTAVVFGAVLWVIMRVIPMGRTTTGSFQ